MKYQDALSCAQAIRDELKNRSVWPGDLTEEREGQAVIKIALLIQNFTNA